jgi:hypothetical protein
MARTQHRSVTKRLKSAALFVGIVWALAGTFVAFELLALSTTRRAFSNPATFGKLMLSRATQESTACDVPPGKAGGQIGAISNSVANARSWLLGVNFGRDAQSRQWGGTGSQGDKQVVASIEQLSGMLAVPTPATFTAAQIANANTEFVSFVEGDAAGTAHGLALQYSPNACRLFKLGAFWGYSLLVRVALPGERSIYAIEIDYYGRQIGLPDELMRAMTAPTSANASRGELASETIALTDAVTKHLGATP